MISLGPFILIAGISIVILLCWAWLPFATLAKLLGLGGHRKKDTGLLPVRAAAGEARYRTRGFVPPPQALRNNPRAFDPEVRHHEYLKVENPLRAGEQFQDRGGEATFGPDSRSGGRPPRSGEQRQKRSAGSAGREMDGGVQKPAATFGRNQERWDRLHSHLEA